MTDRDRLSDADTNFYGSTRSTDRPNIRFSSDAQKILKDAGITSISEMENLNKKELDDLMVKVKHSIMNSINKETKYSPTDYLLPAKDRKEIRDIENRAARIRYQTIEKEIQEMLNRMSKK